MFKQSVHFFSSWCVGGALIWSRLLRAYTKHCRGIIQGLLLFAETTEDLDELLGRNLRLELEVAVLVQAHDGGVLCLERLVCVLIQRIHVALQLLYLL